MRDRILNEALLASAIEVMRAVVLEPRPVVAVVTVGSIDSISRRGMLPFRVNGPLLGMVACGGVWWRVVAM